MSNGTNYYKFETEKELIDYLGDDLKRMVYGIMKNNIVIEEQYDKLDSYIIEEHGAKLRKILSELTGEEILYDYSPSSGMFFLYAYCNMKREKAFVEVSEWSEIYYM